MKHHQATPRTLAPERKLFKAIEVVEVDSGNVIHAVTIDPPCDERSIDRRLAGMMHNLRPDCFLREVEV